MDEEHRIDDWAMFEVSKDEDGCLELFFAFDGMETIETDDGLSIHFGEYSVDTLRKMRDTIDRHIEAGG